MTVGSSKKTDENVNANGVTELYDHSTSLWSTKTFYPYLDTLTDYQIVSLSESFIIFGGFDEKRNISISTIAKFELAKNVWIELGNLQFSRSGFGVTTVQQLFLVVGGQERKRTEMCTVTGDKIHCKSREPTLYKVQHYPAMMVIKPETTDRCKNFVINQTIKKSSTKFTTS